MTNSLLATRQHEDIADFIAKQLYIDKLDEYQRLGIPESWIVDYLAIGSRNYLGNPKVSTVFVYQLDASGVYQSTAYRGSDRIVSPTFPDLELTVEQILDA